MGYSRNFKITAFHNKAKQPVRLIDTSQQSVSPTAQHTVGQYSVAELEAVTANQSKCAGLLPILTSRTAICFVQQMLIWLLMSLFHSASVCCFTLLHRAAALNCLTNNPCYKHSQYCTKTYKRIESQSNQLIFFFKMFFPLVFFIIKVYWWQILYVCVCNM